MTGVGLPILVVTTPNNGKMKAPPHGSKMLT